MSVGTWADSIRDLAENQECRLRRIVHCKAKSGSRDEFLLLYVRHPSDRDAVVLADRDTTFDTSSVHADEDMDMPPPYARADASRDYIRLSSDGTGSSLTRAIPGGWADICTVKFPKKRGAPSVAHLAVLLTVVHRHVMSPGSSVEMRSGWFAYCVAEVMREVFLGKSRVNKEWVRVPYGGMRVNDRDTVDTLIREFSSAWEDFDRRQAERKSKHKKTKKARNARTSSLVDMLRTMDV